MRHPRNFVPDRCYHLISRIANRAFYLGEDERTRFVARMWRVAYFSCVEVLAILADGPRSPSEMRGMLGIASANYFTARYITPMKESGLIAPVNAASLHSPWQAYRLTPKGRKVLS